MTPTGSRERWRADRREESQRLRGLGLGAAFAYRWRESGASNLRMIGGLGAVMAYTAICAIWLVLTTEFNWRPVVGLVVNPFAWVLLLRGWVYGRLGTFAIGLVLALAAMIVPWMIGGRWDLT